MVSTSWYSSNGRRLVRWRILPAFFVVLRFGLRRLTVVVPSLLCAKYRLNTDAVSETIHFVLGESLRLFSINTWDVDFAVSEILSNEKQKHRCPEHVGFRAAFQDFQPLPWMWAYQFPQTAESGSPRQFRIKKDLSLVSKYLNMCEVIVFCGFQTRGLPYVQLVAMFKPGFSLASGERSMM